MKQIEQTYEIKAPVEKVWQTLTDAKLIEAWGAVPAEFDAKEGGDFSLWGGDIHGTNTKVVPNKLLEQNWYGQDDRDEPYKVSFTLEQKGDATIVKLVHADVPDEEYQDYADGWKDYYFDPIKDLLEAWQS